MADDDLDSGRDRPTNREPRGAQVRQAARERAEGAGFGQSGPTEDQEAEEWQARGERIADLAGQLCGYFYNHEYRDFEKALVEMESALAATEGRPMTRQAPMTQDERSKMETAWTNRFCDTVQRDGFVNGWTAAYAEVAD